MTVTGDSAPEDAGLLVLNDRQVEPLFSIHTQRCRERVARQLAAEERSMRALLDAGTFRRVDLPSSLRAALVNVNTLAEFAEFQASQGDDPPRAP